MQQQESKESQFSVGLVAGTAVAVLLLGGMGSFWAWRTLTGGGGASVDDNPSPPVTEDEGRILAQASEVKIYGIVPTETGFDFVTKAIPVESGTTERDALRAALTAVLSEPDTAEFVSTIPAGTKLLDVSVESDGNIRVNLSGEFNSGGGSASMMGRLGQVLYTATSLDPDAGVLFDLDGTPLMHLGGEGLVVSRPMTRADFESEFEF